MSPLGLGICLSLSSSFVGPVPTRISGCLL